MMNLLYVYRWIRATSAPEPLNAISDYRKGIKILKAIHLSGDGLTHILTA